MGQLAPDDGGGGAGSLAGPCNLISWASTSCWPRAWAGIQVPLTWTRRPTVTSFTPRARLPSRMAVSPGRATTERPSIVKRLSPFGSTAITASTRPSISMSPWPIPLRFSSVSVSVDPSMRTVMVISWLGRTSAKASVATTLPSSVNTNVKPPSGSPRSVKVPSGPTTVEIDGFSCTLTASVAAPAKVAPVAERPPAPSTVPDKVTPRAPATELGAVGEPPPQATSSSAPVSARPTWNEAERARMVTSCRSLCGSRITIFHPARGDGARAHRGRRA